jgi:signal transduction histidine kinase
LQEEALVTLRNRAPFLVVFVATLLGIVGIALYGFHALDQVAEGATAVRREMERLTTTARVEDTIRDLAAGPVGGDERELLGRLDGLMTTLHELEVGAVDRPLFERFERALADARAARTSESWFRAGEAIGAIELSLIGRSHWSETEVHAERRARRLVLSGAVVVALFGLASAVVYVRMRREERETRERLRRSDRLAALGTVAATVAHEINNPLATIAGCAAAIGDRLRKQPDACSDCVEYLDMIEDETRRCTGIVKSLGDLAREGPAAMAPADLPKLARSVVALLEMDREAKPATFVVEGEDQLEAICDPDKIKQLLFNLLINARDASEAGGRVVVAVERVGDRARVVVRDEGRGIERRDLVRIFEPFHTDKTRGLGIGLFLCERIAALHGGTIHAESEGRGKGARFVVEFPTRLSAAVEAAV